MVGVGTSAQTMPCHAGTLGTHELSEWLRYPTCLTISLAVACTRTMKEQGKKRPRADVQEAPVWVPRQPGARHVHVKKHQQRDKGLEVVFDPKAHK